MKHYRIKEIQGRFIVEVTKTETKGIFWWRKKIIRFVTSDIFGNPLTIHTAIGIPKPTAEYKSLKEAEEFINGLSEKPKYHYLTNEPIIFEGDEFREFE